MTKLGRSRLIVFLFPLLLSGPFLTRAYFVDDSYFVEIATWLKDHPTRPYDFRADDAGPQNKGWEDDGFVRMVNPLAHHYFLALLLKFGGEREWLLRLGCVLLNSVAGLFLFALARRWTNHPFLATLLVQSTPAVWLTAHSLLIDSTLFFYFIGALYFYVRATETGSVPSAVASGIMMGMAAVTKYPALVLLPLTAGWLLLRWKKLDNRWRFVIPWGIALVFFLGYSGYTAWLYGSPHVMAASQRMVKLFGWGKYFVFFVFFSGVIFAPLLSWGIIERRRGLIAGAGLAFLLVVLSSPFGGFSVTQSLLLTILFGTSVVFLWAWFRQNDRWIYPRDQFLMLWAILFILEMFVVMGWVAARYYVIVVPAVVWMMQRMIETRWRAKAAVLLTALLAAQVVFGGALAYADYRQAEPSRRIGAALRARGITGGERRFYLGDSFTMSYLKREGWQPYFSTVSLRPGDLILFKEITMPQMTFFKDHKSLRPVVTVEYPSGFPLKVMDYYGSAGFYASVWGALPFTFSFGPWERFHVLEITKENAPNDAVSADRSVAGDR